MLGVVFVLMAPYFAFVTYYSQRSPLSHWPSWFSNTIAIWFIVNFVALMLLMRLTRRLFKTGVVDIEKARAYGERALRTSTCLVIFWSLLFLYGVVQTARGKFPLERAIPAGAFLLFFIALFGWSIYRSKRARKTEHVDD
jgi:UDP-N-acetylmuramyl pentapeptide phosphotransferase/UDP-N-acetylglucosamine-1-phosphate transferase